MCLINKGVVGILLTWHYQGQKDHSFVFGSLQSTHRVTMGRSFIISVLRLGEGSLRLDWMITR